MRPAYPNDRKPVARTAGHSRQLLSTGGERSMTGRRALLIGVPRCDDDAFSDIGEVVRSDVRLMYETLTNSGYETVSPFEESETGAEPTGSRIKAQLKWACKDAPPGSVLLLYFSGHGVTIDGQDYLVPTDAYRDPGALSPDPDGLVPLVPPNLEHCRARLVVYFVDACRDDPAETRGPVMRGGMLPYLPDGDFVVVTGCRAGQRCQHGESGSYFTQALAQALDRRNPARTLEQVLRDVEQQMRRRAAGSDGIDQEPQAHHHGATLPAADTVICEGDRLTDAWRRAVEKTGLWRHCDSEITPTEPTVEAVRAIVEECARHCGRARENLHRRTGIDDPWADQNHPVRVLHHLSMLLGQYAGLTRSEVAALIMAPFLRERVLAEGVRLAAGIDPANFTRTYGAGPRSDLETTHEMHQHIVRRAEGLGSQGNAKARDTLAMWLVHQWLATRLAVWRSPAAQDAYARGARLLDGDAISVAQSELPKLVEGLVRAAGADPVDHQLSAHLRRDYVDDRWRGLAALLWLAGILAADPRRMPPVIADHIGTRLELPLTAVTAAADRMKWYPPKEGVLDLQMICDHPALHLALEDVVRRAGEALGTIRGLPSLGPLGERLPERITAEKLRPEQRKDDTCAYEAPVARFRLAEDKVRELLMGRQLYDDPSLAIRELYQNALDACRYRRTRLAYLSRTGESPAPWEGRIRFEQGVEDGKPYIECEDNGVGMDTETLKHVFANAGERFVYRHEYRAEQADWQDLQPPLRLVANSQFGVGVFSYFMLADEITLNTRPVGRNGIVSPDAYGAHIASSGSLFQITPSGGMHGGGTRVRMYLTGDEEVSVLRTLRALLWVAEFRVEVTEHGSLPEVWEPGELRYRDAEVESLKCGDDLWWVSGKGGLAADGIHTDEEVFGLVVNLRDTHRPTFTVDRKKLREWDRKWVEEEVSRSLPGLVSWPGLTMSWLWELAESDLWVAQLVFRHLVSVATVIPMGGSWGDNTRVLVNIVGCCPTDAVLLDPEQGFLSHSRWFMAWRLGLWSRLITVQFDAWHPRALNTCDEGFPTIDPADGELLQGCTAGDAPVDLDVLLKVVGHTDETVSSRIRRLRRYAITGLDVSAARDIPPLDRTFRKEDQPLLLGFAAWTRSAMPPRRNPAAWLLRASNELEQPLGEVVQRITDLMPPAWTPPPIDLGPLAHYTATVADVQFVSRDLDRVPPWIEQDLTPSEVAARSAAPGQPVEQIFAICDRLAPLGVAVAGRDRYPAGLNGLEIEALRHVHTVGQHLVPIHLVSIAARSGMSVHDAHAGLRRLEACEMVALPDISGLPDLTPNREQLEFIEGKTWYYPLGSQDRNLRTGMAVARMMVRTAARSHLQASRIGQYFQAVIPFTVPDEPVTAVDLVSLACALDCSVGEAQERMIQVYPDMEPLTVTAEEATLEPTEVIATTLMGSLQIDRQNLRWSVSPGWIITGAFEDGRSLGEFLLILDPYRGLGAPIPDPDETARRDLAKVFPDAYDADLLRVFRRKGSFEDDDQSDHYVSTISPLFLVQTAGRYGWTVTEAHRRFARLAPLGLTLEYPADACPDEIVHWQDLLAVTRYLDGQEPALQGAVGEAHIAEAAADLEEPAERVRERLHRYAPLFGFHLDEESAVD
ncbi:HD domain-containing protein [Streptosporangium sandarakinum]|uniref:HD domain-containing protein n=1 Tax=Streptosporangium sandarakinum TaxID=1260955 RepID=UPI0037148C06